MVRKKKQKYKHVVWDIDGTILDSQDAVFMALIQVVLERQGRTVSLEELRAAAGIGGDEVLLLLGFSSEELEEVHNEWESYFRDYSTAVRHYDGVAETLRALKCRGISMGIVTSKNRREYQSTFVPYGLADFFDVTVCVEDSAKPKPDPAPMLTYLERAGVDASEVLYLGDTENDMRCAEGAGVDHALALWGCTDQRAVHEATYRLLKPADVLELIDPSAL